MNPHIPESVSAWWVDCPLVSIMGDMMPPRILSKTPVLSKSDSSTPGVCMPYFTAVAGAPLVP